MTKEYIELDYDQCTMMTESAVLVCIDDKRVWLPLSVLNQEVETPSIADDGGLVEVEVWFAMKEGLI